MKFWETLTKILWDPGKVILTMNIRTTVYRPHYNVWYKYIYLQYVNCSEIKCASRVPNTLHPIELLPTSAEIPN